MVIADLKTRYGINTRSVLCELLVLKQFPQDIMQTLMEGNVQYEARLVLLNFIQNGDLSVKEINGAITSHNYGYSEISNKPVPLRETVIFGEERYKLKLKASQTRLFLRILPFLISYFLFLFLFSYFLLHLC